MATIPIYSPSVPFLGLIPGGMSPGRMVRIKGVINNHGDRCQINIQTGAALNPRDDVTLHVSIQPNDRVIVRNTLQRQVWGAEERYGHCPVHYGQQFDLLILAEANLYKIAVNGAHFCTFHHRLPLHLAQYVSISGNCVVHSITSEMDTVGGSSSAVMPPYPAVPPVTHHPPPPPPYTPSPGPIGFVPAPPPMPPPPPYTPSPSYPLGGGGSHYPGTGPTSSPYPHPGPHNHATAVPYSHVPSAPVMPPVSGPPTTVKQTIASGIQQTKQFLHDTITGRTTSGAPGYPKQMPAYPGYPAGPPQPPAQYFAGYPQPPPAPGARLGTAALATGATTAAVMYGLNKKKSKKLLKYGAAAGAIGLGGYAVTKAFKKRRGSSSSSSSSSSD